MSALMFFALSLMVAAVVAFATHPKPVPVPVKVTRRARQ